MTSKDDCKNCTHSKESHELMVEYPGGSKVLPGTIMHDTHIESEIKCTQCKCQEYVPIDDSDHTESQHTENNSEKYDSFDKTYTEKPEMFGHPYKELQNYFVNCSIRGNLLDLGCGQGRDSIFLASLGYDVTAVDNSKVGIIQMLDKAQPKKLAIDGIVGDIQNLKLDRTFNVILFDMLLHGFEKHVQLELLRKYFNYLNKDGILCIVYPDDVKAEHFMSMLKSLSQDWKLLDELTIDDIPKIEGEIIDYKFRMMIAQHLSI